MDDKLRIAIVGVGRMGSFHARTLDQSDHVDVVAVADTSGDAGVALATELDAEFFSSPETLLASDTVEAWLIATPTLSHPAMVRMALDGGLPVLCEKPPALDPAGECRVGESGDAGQSVASDRFLAPFRATMGQSERTHRRRAIGRPLLLRLSQWDADPPPASFWALRDGVGELDRRRTTGARGGS